MFFFFKQTTAYEMRISDWSSDVSSSDLVTRAVAFGPLSLRERAGVRVRRNDDSQTTAANNHAREPTLLAPSPVGRGLGCGYGEITTVKTPLPTTTLRNARDRTSTRLNYSH